VSDLLRFVVGCGFFVAVWRVGLFWAAGGGGLWGGEGWGWLLGRGWCWGVVWVVCGSGFCA